MAYDRKALQVIGEALARAMYDAPLHVLSTMNKDGFSQTAAMEIARRMVRELDHAGWNPKQLSREGVRQLEDQICLGLSMADCTRLASQSPEWSKQARDKATRCICAALGYQKVILVRRNATYNRP
jgi:hypothetical protein